MGMMVSPHRYAAGGGGGSDPYWGKVVLLIGADSAVTDESTFARTITTVAPALRNTTTTKFGGGSLDPNNTGKFTAPNSSDFQFGSEAFTLELWVKTSVSDELLRFAVVGPTSDAAFYVYLNAGKLAASLSTSGSTFTLTLASGTITVTDNTWHHVVVERSGSTIRTYVDGAMDQKGQFTGSLFASTQVLTIGDGLTGQIDDLRITKGIARYASDSGYTAPTAAFPRSGTTSFPSPTTTYYTFDGTVDALFSNAAGAGWVPLAQADATIGTTKALANPDISGSGNTLFTWTVPTAAYSLTTRYKISSEANFDFFRVLLNGTQVLQASGNPGTFAEYVLPVELGDVITYRYSKDGSGDVGTDDVRISRVTLIS